MVDVGRVVESWLALPGSRRVALPLRPGCERLGRIQSLAGCSHRFLSRQFAGHLQQALGTYCGWRKVRQHEVHAAACRHPHGSRIPQKHPLDTGGKQSRRPRETKTKNIETDKESSHRFQKRVGHTPSEEIQRVRINLIKSLLQNTDHSIAEIAERTGFTYAEYMTATFRRETGQTPTQYRAECLKSHRSK